MYINCVAGGITDHYNRVLEFMCKARQLPIEPAVPQIPDAPTRLLRATLILEEALETITKGLGIDVVAVQENGKATFRCIYPFTPREPDLVEIADGCADSKVVITGTLIACGLPDIDIQREVDFANLAKFAPGHYLRDDGKLIKPPDFVPADVAGVIDRLTSLAKARTSEKP